MDFGSFVLFQSPEKRSTEQVYSSGVEIAKVSEQLGFTRVWLAEHHFSSYCYVSNPLMMAVHIANNTQSIRIGTAVLVVPLHHPLMIAEQIATADQLTGGRLDIGLGRGYERYGFDRFGVPIEENWERWEESIGVILRALSGESFSNEGKFYGFPDSFIFPESFQKPYPPIWMVGQTQKPDTIASAVKHGFGVLGGGSAVPVEKLEELGRLVKEEVNKSKTLPSSKLAVQRWVYVADNDSDAIEVADHYGRWGSRVARGLAGGELVVTKGSPVLEAAENQQNVNDIIGRNVIGTPETCIRQLQHLRDTVGVDHMMCNFWFGDLPQEKVLKSMERFVKSVKPNFH